jgi:hypothetical protein
LQTARFREAEHDLAPCHFWPYLVATVLNPPYKTLVLPTLHPQEHMRRNEPCWCLSGKKWKVCHRDRDTQTPVNVFQLFDQLRDEFATGYCLHPDAVSDACTTIVNAHTIQKRGGLAAIAESNHVLSVKQGFYKVPHHAGAIIPTRLSINKASTFPGFCSKHDSSLFRPAEYGAVAINNITAFLLSYRAIAYELFAKEAAIRATPILQQSDKGRPFHDQCYCQDYIQTRLCGLKMGMHDIMRLKSRYGALYSTSAYNDFHFYAVIFSGVLPVVSCGAISPEYDFSGKSLQDVLRSPQPVEQVAFNLTCFGDASVVMFGWVDRNGPAEGLATSFRQLPSAEKANAAVRFAFEYIENTMIRPSWWDTLGEIKQQQAMQHLAAGFPEREFEHDHLALSARQYQFVSCDVTSEIWSDYASLDEGV